VRDGREIERRTQKVPTLDPRAGTAANTKTAIRVFIDLPRVAVVATSYDTTNNVKRRRQVSRIIRGNFQNVASIIASDVDKNATQIHLANCIRGRGASE
jgi:hypothetical protein